jgi:Cu-Zn family superoxide dismutase
MPSVCIAVLLTACASAPPPQPATSARGAAKAQAILAPASGSRVSGTVEFRAIGDGVHLRGSVGGLARYGQHAIHVHETGDCSAADAAGAGGHFNPTGQPHGRAGHGPHHAGDMDNLAADGDGVARVDLRLHGVSLGTGAASDIAGRALIVHAQADDYTSQPTGNAGARIACAVIRLMP